MTRMRKITIAVGALALLGTAPAAGMQTQYAMASAPAAESERADELRAEAEALFSQPKRWKKAMRLLQESAALRSAEDAEAYECLMYAGRLGAAVGEYEAARDALQQAAEHALARGAVKDAAFAYIDAAHAAGLAQDVEDAKELLGRAALLTSSPLLSAEDRTALNYRLRA